MSTTDSVHGRSSLRPLMPRPLFNNSFSSIIGNNLNLHLSSLHNPKWTTHPTFCSDYGGKRVGAVAAPPLVSSRWNPTAEQVQALEEMYRRGTRTPTAEQIQQIAAKLRRFGKIEGKNVFYWFQNHKARDRQKKRRQLELLAAKNDNNSSIPHRKQSGLCRKYMEMEQNPPPKPKVSKCRTGSNSKYDGGEVGECKRERWTSSSCNPSPHKIINEKSSAQENTFTLNLHVLPSTNDDLRSGIEENRTLELFPLMGSGVSTLSSTKEEMDDVSSTGNKLVPNQFFEFLPTKN